MRFAPPKGDSHCAGQGQVSHDAASVAPSAPAQAAVAASEYYYQPVSSLNTHESMLLILSACRLGQHSSYGMADRCDVLAGYSSIPV